jgi:ribosome-associated protein
LSYQGAVNHSGCVQSINPSFPIQEALAKDVMSIQTTDIEVMKKAVVDALEDIKGFEITVMDVRKLTSMATYMVICNATSTRQAKALASNVRDKLKELGVNARGIEGEKEGEWVLVDLGDIIVHIMLPTTRAYYNLEQLWGTAEGRRQRAKSDSTRA